MAQEARKPSEKVLKEAKLSRLADVNKRLIELYGVKKDYILGNRIEYFNKEKTEEEPYNLPANPIQAELLTAWMDNQYKVFTYTGGNRIGKTTIGTGIIAIATLLGHWPWDERVKLWFPHNKPRKVRIVGQDWERHVKTVIVPELHKWWPKRRKVEIRRNNVGVDAIWTAVESGSTLEIVSNKQESDLLEGWQGDLIVYDEPPKRRVRVACARGLVDRQGRELFCMTLLKEAWVDREVIKATIKENGVDTGRPDSSVYNVHGDIYTNVGFGITEAGVQQFEKTLTDDEKDARLRGIPSYMSGLVAKYFDRKKHLKDRFEIPTSWPVDIAVDIHPRKEQAVLFVAVSPQQNKYVCFEILMHGSGTDVGDAIIRTVARNGLKVNRIVCDPLAKGDSNNPNTTFDKIQSVLMAHGHYMEVAAKDKQSGIIEINKHLKGPNGEPSIFIFNDLVRTIYEIEGWMYDEETQKPLKVDDDMMENLYRILLLDTVFSYNVPDNQEWRNEAFRAEAEQSSTAGWY